MEIWKDIPGFDGAYAVSNLARVRSNARVSPHPLSGNRLLKEKILQSHVSITKGRKDGYLRVTFYYKGKNKKLLTHVLVGNAFVQGKTLERKFLNHKDGIKTNCLPSNLEWVTRKENSDHAWNTGLSRKRIGIEANRSRPVIQIDKLGNRVAEYFSIEKAHQATGVAKGNISAVCCGLRPYAGGFQWQHANA